MTDDEPAEDITSVIARLAALPDPAMRAREANELIDTLEAMAKEARKVRQRGIAELLAAGHGPAAVARAVGMSVSTVKIVKQQQDL